MRKLRWVVVTTVGRGHRFSASSIFRGEQSLAAAVADYYEFEDVELVAHELGKMIVKLKAAEMKKGGVENGTEVA